MPGLATPSILDLDLRWGISPSGDPVSRLAPVEAIKAAFPRLPAAQVTAGVHALMRGHYWTLREVDGTTDKELMHRCVNLGRGRLSVIRKLIRSAKTIERRNRARDAMRDWIERGAVVERHDWGTNLVFRQRTMVTGVFCVAKADEKWLDDLLVGAA